MRLTKHLIILILSNVVLLAQPKISSSIDARQVLVQESFTWTIEVSGSDEMPNIRLPDIKRIALLSGPMQSSNYTYANGKASSKKTLTYTFVALEAGPVVIPSVQVYLGKDVYQTNALKLDIVATKTSRGAKSEQTVFLRAIPSKRTVFIGEPISVKYKLPSSSLFTVGLFNKLLGRINMNINFSLRN